MRAPAIADVAIRPPSAAEIEKLLGAAAEHRLIALFTVAARTGLRQGEILGLGWADVDLDGGMLHVRGTLDRDTRRRGPTKTSESAASVPLIPAVVIALRAHRSRQLEERIAAGRWREPERVFVTREGRALDGRAVTRMLHRMQDRHGVRRFRFHDLRHALATGMLASGASPFDVMVAVRHSRIGTTVDQYGHRTPEQMARIRSLMAEAAAPVRS
jgi:integrase